MAAGQQELTHCTCKIHSWNSNLYVGTPQLLKKMRVNNGHFFSIPSCMMHKNCEVYLIFLTVKPSSSLSLSLIGWHLPARNYLHSPMLETDQKKSFLWEDSNLIRDMWHIIQTSENSNTFIFILILKEICLTNYSW